MITPREYQTECLNKIIGRYEHGITRQLVSLPTGTGKTVIFSHLAKTMNRRTLILAHRDELLDQAIAKLRMVWPEADIGKVKATQDETDAHVVVASVQSAARKNRLQRLARQNFGLLIIDECHHAAADSYKRIVHDLDFMVGDPSRLCVGLTATPARADGLALGTVFQEIVYEASLPTMIRAGYLCDLSGIAVKTETDLSNVGCRAGEYQTGQLAQAVDTPARNQIAVEAYLEHAADRKAIAFCANVDHARSLADTFSASGISAAAVWGDMPTEDRRRTLAGFDRGRLQVVTNCGVLTEGFDQPDVSALLMCRPTRSQGLYIQMVGRGTRTYPGKQDCVVIDMVDAGRHQAVMLATLAGRPIKAGETLAEALDRSQREKQAQQAGVVGQATSKAFEVFGRTDFRWFGLPDGGYRLLLEPTKHLKLDHIGPDQFFVHLVDTSGGQTTIKPIAGGPLSLGYGQGVCEDYARKHGGSFSRSDAIWTQRPATGAQLSTLARLGIRPEPSITSGQASALIQEAVIEREARRGEPATEKQRQLLSKLRIPFNDNLTKGEAKRLIAKALEAVSA